MDVDTLSKDTTHYYRVFAFNKYGNSAFSNTDSILVPFISKDATLQSLTVNKAYPIKVRGYWNSFRLVNNNFNKAGHYVFVL